MGPYCPHFTLNSSFIDLPVACTCIVIHIFVHHWQLHVVYQNPDTTKSTMWTESCPLIHICIVLVILVQSRLHGIKLMIGQIVSAQKSIQCYFTYICFNTILFIHHWWQHTLPRYEGYMNTVNSTLSSHVPSVLRSCPFTRVHYE